MASAEKRFSVLIGWVIPLVLIVLSYFGLGFYYETNDDQIITLLLRGIFSDKPQTNP